MPRSPCSRLTPAGARIWGPEMFVPQIHSTMAQLKRADQLAHCVPNYCHIISQGQQSRMRERGNKFVTVCFRLSIKLALNFIVIQIFTVLGPIQT